MKRSWIGLRLKIALVVWLLAPIAAHALPAGIVVPATPVSDPSTLCAAALNLAQTVVRTPPGLLNAIATVESGRRDAATGHLAPWPWTIDANGTGHAYPSEAQAVAAAQQFENQGINSLDIGCMQINLLHHPHAFTSLAQAFDPMSNVIYGAQFLRRLKTQLGRWTPAVGAYHSETPALGLPYEQRVLAVWHDAGGTGGGMGAAVPTLIPVAAGMSAVPKVAAPPAKPGTSAPGAIAIRQFGVGGFAFAGLHGHARIIPIAASIGTPGSSQPTNMVGRSLAAYRSNPIPVTGAK